MSGTQSVVRPTTLIVNESKTVAQLLKDLGLTKDHVVLIDGKRLAMDDIVPKESTVVVLPLIAGG